MSGRKELYLLRGKRKTNLSKDSILLLIAEQALPSMAGLVLQTSYSLADTFFISHWVGDDAVAALAIVFPLQLFIMAAAQGLGIGASAIIARDIGGDDFIAAETALGTMTSSAILLSSFIALTAGFYISPVLTHIGASQVTLPIAIVYGRIILIGSPLLSYSIASNAVARAEGNAKMAMKTLLISAGINFILDPLFIYYMKLGVAGAAWATIISQLCSALWMWVYFCSGKSSLRLKKKNLIPDLGILSKIFYIGSSAFVRQGTSGITATIMNRALLFYGGDAAVAAIGVLGKIVIFAYMPLFGLVQGMMPIVSHNMGARLECRVFRSVDISMLGATLICSAGAAALLLFPESILGLFCSGKALETALRAAPYIAISMPIVGFQVILSGTYQAMGEGGHASLLALTRTVLVKVPSLYIMPPVIGITGIFWTFPVTETISGAICFVLFKKVRDNLKKICSERSD